MEGSCGGVELSGISLRRLGLSDIDDFMVWGTDEKVARFLTLEPYASKEEGLNHIKEKILPHPWFRAICLDGRPVGVILGTRIQVLIVVELKLVMPWGPSYGVKGLLQEQ